MENQHRYFKFDKAKKLHTRKQGCITITCFYETGGNWNACVSSYDTDSECAKALDDRGIDNVSNRLIGYINYCIDPDEFYDTKNWES